MNPGPPQPGTGPGESPMEGSIPGDSFEHGSWEHALISADADACEALFESALDPDRVEAGHADRACRVAEVLDLLRTPAPAERDREALLHASLARIARLSAPAVVSTAEPVLSPRDEDAIESLVSVGWNASRTPRAVRDRADRAAGLLAMLERPAMAASTPAEAEMLVQRTLRGVERAEGEQADRMKFETTAGRTRGGNLRLADVASIAAVLTVGAAVTWPALVGMREYARRTSCQANLASLGVSLAGYAADYRDSLPLASEARAGTVWWDVGNPERSNSANLFNLVRSHYARLESTACAGNEHAPGSDELHETDPDWHSIDQISYSLQNLFASQRPGWSSPDRLVVVVDRSPVVPLAIRGRWIDPFANSPNHGGRGQAALLNDGAVVWLTSPVWEGDNIWLPGPIEQILRQLASPEPATEPLEGREAPAGPDDAFMVP